MFPDQNFGKGCRRRIKNLFPRGVTITFRIKTLPCEDDECSRHKTNKQTNKLVLHARPISVLARLCGNFKTFRLNVICNVFGLTFNGEQMLEHIYFLPLQCRFYQARLS
jgi:hypothetical protein